MLKLTTEQTNKVLKRQRELEDGGNLWYFPGADIDYQCYYEKISESQFWKKYLWEYLGLGEFCKEQEEVGGEISNSV